MQWFQVKEKAAGKKRLLLTWYLYRIFGIKIALIIAFFISVITILTNKDIREYSRKYFETLYLFTSNKNYKPSLLNTFRHVYSYAESLVYKMETYTGTFKNTSVKFVDKALEKTLFEQIKNKEGIIFICNHIGNIEILRSFLYGNAHYKPTTVSVILQRNHCNIFNNFMNRIGKPLNSLKIYPIEEMDITTASELDDNLKMGGILFIAGDRISVNNPDKNVEANLLNKKIYLPLGTFKLVQALNHNTYIISCLKNNNEYEVYLEKQPEGLGNIIIDNYVKFLEKMISIAPYQFYHFYDMFK